MKRIALTLVSVLMGLMLLNSGLNKFFHYMPMPENMPDEIMKDTNALMEISWLMPLIGFFEVVGAILLMIPRTRALGVLILFPIMVGILLTHVVVEPSGLVIVLVMWAILLWIIYEERNKYVQLVK